MIRCSWMVGLMAAWLLVGVDAASAQGVRFITPLASSPGIGSAGTGTVTVTFDNTALTLTVQAAFSGLTGNVTAAHIHCCTATPGAGTAGVATMTPSFAGFPSGVTSGSYQQTFDLTSSLSYSAAFVTNNGGTVAAARAALFAGLLNGSAYFDIHTPFAPGGEVRAFLPVVYDLSVASAARVEGNSGSASLSFTVSLSTSAPSPITVLASTANGTATAGSDYTAAGPTTITFNPGDTAKTFPVSVLGDAVPEFDETFTVTLSSPAGAVLLAGTATGTILNDDGTPQPPVVANDTYTVPANTTLDVAAPDVLGNDQSPAPGLTAALIGAPAHGAVAVQANGAFTYTPQSGYIGADAFTYRATNIAGPSSLATVSIAVTAPTGPVPPTALRVVGVSGNVVTFGWNPPTLGATPVGYQLEGGVTPGGVLGAVALGPAPRFSIALPTATLYIRLRTVSAVGTSVPTADLVVPVNQPLLPSAPANLIGLGSGTAVSLAWRSTFTGGAPLGAVLDVSGAASTSLSLGPVETFDFPSVPPGTYTFAVRQMNATGVGPASNPVTLTFPATCTGAPLPVENFAAFTVGGRLVLAWDPASTGAAPTTYLVQATGAYTGAVPLATRGIDVPVAPGSYTLAVRAVNACGTSASTSPQTVIVP